MSERVFIDGDRAWVEFVEDHLVVSWPDGHRTLPADAGTADLLHLVQYVIRDLRREHVKIRGADAAKAWSRGYEHGYLDARRGRPKAS